MPTTTLHSASGAAVVSLETLIDDTPRHYLQRSTDASRRSERRDQGRRPHGTHIAS